MSKIKLFSILSVAILGAHMTTTPIDAQVLVQKKQSTVEAMLSTRKSVEKREAGIAVRMFVELVNLFVTIFVMGLIMGMLIVLMPGIDLDANVMFVLSRVLVEGLGITKKRFGLVVVDAKGVPLTMDKMFIRMILKYLPPMPLVTWIGLPMYGRFLHDKFIDSYVIHAEMANAYKVTV